jgi:hypothetical protein
MCSSLTGMSFEYNGNLYNNFYVFPVPSEIVNDYGLDAFDIC